MVFRDGAEVAAAADRRGDLPLRHAVMCALAEVTALRGGERPVEAAVTRSCVRYSGGSRPYWAGPVLPARC